MQRDLTHAAWVKSRTLIFFSVLHRIFIFSFLHLLRLAFLHHEYCAFLHQGLDPKLSTMKSSFPQNKASSRLASSWFLFVAMRLTLFSHVASSWFLCLAFLTVTTNSWINNLICIKFNIFRFHYVSLMKSCKS